MAIKLETLYGEVVKKGIEADPRNKKEIDRSLKEKKEEYTKLPQKDKELFDQDCLFNPFSDTRILWGNPESQINSMIVGIDVGGGELLLVDSLKSKGKKIDH